MKNILFVGHACLDIVADNGIIEGGACVYGGALASYLTQDVTVVTSVAKEFPRDKFPKIRWINQPSQVSTKYRHEYEQGRRVSYLYSRAQSIIDSEIPEQFAKSDVVMLCPIVQEITPEIVNRFETSWIGLTPQGWFRKFDSRGIMSHTRSVFRELPRKIKLIVVSHEDMSQDAQAWSWIKEYAEVAVCTRGRDGYLLFSNGIEEKFSPMEVMQEKNPTGCGDIFATGLLYLLRKGISPSIAARHAGHAAGLASTQEGITDSAKIAADYLLTI